ncbi:MAG: ROK family glucokinase [Lachnospiraceae bacterium]|nr:ROK family glucokinase [Lachnospiraceae bacterium]
MNCFFGVDVGGTTVKIGLFTPKGALMEKWEIPTNKQESGRRILPDIAASLREKCRQKGWRFSEMSGIGLGVPGPVTENGTVLKCINLGWDVFSVTETLQDLTGLPVFAGNDATVAALGETAALEEPVKNSVLVTLGTGVGGGIVLNGDILYGSVGAAGEIGHIHVCDTEEETCSCGNRGCLEQYASASGFVRVAKKLLQKTSSPGLLTACLQEMTARDIFDCAKKGDPLANRIVDLGCFYLGQALAITACVINPELFILGGGVSKAGPILIERTEPVFRKYAFHACRNARFVLASLGNDAGIYGAARLVLNSLKTK